MSLLERFQPSGDRDLRLNLLVGQENALGSASGYHSPARFHKDPNPASPAEARLDGPRSPAKLGAFAAIKAA
jgi:hypothetical protein